MLSMYNILDKLDASTMTCTPLLNGVVGMYNVLEILLYLKSLFSCAKKTATPKYEWREKEQMNHPFPRQIFQYNNSNMVLQNLHCTRPCKLLLCVVYIILFDVFLGHQNTVNNEPRYKFYKIFHEVDWQNGA